MHRWSYYDPHYKPDRTASKYAADKRRDEKSAQENAIFVAEFLAAWIRAPKNANPAETFKQLRIEARRRNFKGKSREALSAQKSKDKLTRRHTEKPSHGPLGAQQAAGKRLAKRPKNAPIKGLEAVPHAITQRAPSFPKARLELGSSVRFLDFTGEELVAEYAIVQSKIDAWRAEYDDADERRRQQLATQLQIQYVKRRDLLALLDFRLRE